MAEAGGDAAARVWQEEEWERCAGVSVWQKSARGAGAGVCIGGLLLLLELSQ